MKVAIVGDGEIASDIFGTFDRAGLAPSRVSTLDVGGSRKLADAELVLEASEFSVGAKRALLRALTDHTSKSAMVCSDESVVPRRELLEGSEADFRRRFAVSHFFIPTQKLALVELVTGGELDLAYEKGMLALFEGPLRREILRCGDTPGFVANRMGLYLAFRAVQLATELELRPDRADAILVAGLGLPRIGAFGLFDLVGFEKMVSISEGLRERLPKNDAWQKCDSGIHAPSKLVRESIKLGIHNFYKKQPVSGNRMTFDRNVGDYVACSENVGRDARYEEFELRLREELVDYGKVVSDTADVSPGIVELALRSGFGWKRGRFADPEDVLPTAMQHFP
jgi:3-hydroxyacyl-CoA dehydrogenase